MELARGMVGTVRDPRARRDGSRISARMPGTRTLERHEDAVSMAFAGDLSTTAAAELLGLQSRKRRLERRIDEVRRERSRQADCIGELHFQDADAAARTHEERMAALREELTALRGRLETVEAAIDRTVAAVTERPTVGFERSSLP